MAATLTAFTYEPMTNSPPAIRFGRFRLPQCASVTAAIAAAWLAAPAMAQTSDLHGAAWTTGGPYSQDSYTSVPYATLSGVHSIDTVGNKSAGTGSLATPAGTITLTSHACSGGRPGWGGQANGNANADVTLDYQIVSATLVAGTPVQVSVRWAESATVKAVGQDMLGVNTGANAGAYSQVVIYVNYSAVENRSGVYSSRHNVPDGFNIGSSGSLNRRGLRAITSTPFWSGKWSVYS